MFLLIVLVGQWCIGKIDMCCWYVLVFVGDIMVWWEWWNDVEIG